MNIVSLCSRNRRDGLRAMLRGYRLLKKSGRSSLIYDLHTSLRQTPLLAPTAWYSTTIFGAAMPHAELVVRQTLASRENLITKALLKALGGKGAKVVLPLPHHWLTVIESHGFRVAYIRSSIMFFVSGLYHLAIGSAQISRNLFKCFLLKSKVESGDQPFVYFCDLVDSNLPQPPGNPDSFCIVNWYRHWNGRGEDGEVIGHSVAGYPSDRVGDTRLRYFNSMFPPLGGALSFSRYFFLTINAIAISAFDLLRGRWWHALLLREASFAGLVRYGDRRLLARRYLFHQSRLYPPLWTYELPSVGSEAISYWYSTNSEFYWYSTNSEVLHRKDAGKHPSLSHPYITNWPNYIVWDLAQANFTRRFEGKDPTISIVGPIWFQDSAKILDNIFPGPIIAVFAVQPFRTSAYQVHAPAFEYYVPEICNKFLLDVVNASVNLNTIVAMKRKRQIGKLVHPSHARCVESLVSRSEVSEVDPSISAFRLIERVDIVISMPFTSTALSARHKGKPSIYYDPSFLITPSHPGSHGIPIIQGRADLEDWLRAQVASLKKPHSLASV